MNRPPIASKLRTSRNSTAFLAQGSLIQISFQAWLSPIVRNRFRLSRKASSATPFPRPVMSVTCAARNAILPGSSRLGEG